ncbi:hypothetical protein [Pedobacter duraquae]|uniref:Redox-active disulfide protein 2 n=1 Tax=Pedobacter duraquae TaxID=425511 RepID=A0A4R6INV9_9SPHI|nr:hypothetical protein [Pedobacter duraquae]TDO23867.1 hypothetical protein CLV32_0153 [Pedobacter duraquae]
MKTTILSELSLEELSIEKKKRGAMVGAYIAIIIMMVGAGVVVTIRKGTSIFTFFPLVFVPIFLVIYKGYGDVNKEIKSRNEA